MPVGSRAGCRVFNAGYLAWAGMGRRRQVLGWTWPFSLIGALGLFTPGATLEFRHHARGRMLCTVVGLIILLFADIKTNWIVGPAKWVARYSFGICLTHQSWLYIAFVRQPGSEGYAWPMLIAGTAVISVVLYHAVDESFVRLGQRWATRRHSVCKPWQELKV